MNEFLIALKYKLLMLIKKISMNQKTLITKILFINRQLIKMLNI